MGKLRIRQVDQDYEYKDQVYEVGDKSVRFQPRVVEKFGAETTGGHTDERPDKSPVSKGVSADLLGLSQTIQDHQKTAADKRYPAQIGQNFPWTPEIEGVNKVGMKQRVVPDRHYT